MRFPKTQAIMIGMYPQPTGKPNQFLVTEKSRKVWQKESSKGYLDGFKIMKPLMNADYR